MGGVGVRHVDIRARVLQGGAFRHAALRGLLTLGNGVPLAFRRARCPSLSTSLLSSSNALCSIIVLNSTRLLTTRARTHTGRRVMTIAHQG